MSPRAFGKPQSFTARFPGTASVLKTTVHIGPPIDAKESSAIPRPDGPGLAAIWDTGATNTVVTKAVAKALALRPVGVARCKTVGGERDSSMYFVSLFLPNRVCVPQVRVFEGEIADGDVLIGMDIIKLGDFAVTNLRGKTTLSFRVPSICCLDFVEEEKGSRNRQCPCGSGKKYKHCCGKG